MGVAALDPSYAVTPCAGEEKDVQIRMLFGRVVGGEGLSDVI